MARAKASVAANGDVDMTLSSTKFNGDVVSDSALPGEDAQSNESNVDFEEFESDNDMDEDDMEEDDGDDEDDDASDTSMDGGIPVPAGRAISPSSIPFSSTAAAATETTPSLLSAPIDPTSSAALNPQPPTPYVPDAGHLLITDPNPLTLPAKPSSAALETALTATARNATQALLNHLLTTCPIHSVPVTATSASGITMTLPPPTMQLPREKKIPVPKPPTKWEQFAARKGIGKHRKGGAGGVGAAGELRSTEGKMVYDEASGEWVHKWGYKGRNKQGEGDWLVEVDEKKEAKAQEPADPRAASRAERKERLRRNERAQRANERRGRKNKAGT